MSKDDGGSAFPNKYDLAMENEVIREEGMTLRDYFAAKAMQSIYMRLGGGPCAGSDHDGGLTNVAKNAYYMADAMLAERAK